MWEEPDAHDEGRRPRGGCEQPRHHRAPGWSQQAAAIRTLGATCAYNSATSLPAAGCRGQKGGRLLLVAGGQKEGGCCWLQEAKRMARRMAAAGQQAGGGGRRRDKAHHSCNHNDEPPSRRLAAASGAQEQLVVVPQPTPGLPPTLRSM